MSVARHRRSMINLFEDVGAIYAGPMRLTWEQPRHVDPVRHGLALLLGSYAFERAGAAPNYAPAAVRALEANAETLQPAPVWRSFKHLIDGPVNEKLNPLYHLARRTCRCALCVLTDTAPNGIVAHSRTLLEHDNVAAAHQQLTAIRGVGPKIASFFLRDVAIWFDLEPTTDRALLQPIDLWVQRFVRMLDPTVPAPAPTVAAWITRHSAHPELANAGMWYFGARIAPASIDYEEALRDSTYARRLVDRYVKRITLSAAAWNLRP